MASTEHSPPASASSTHTVLVLVAPAAPSGGGLSPELHAADRVLLGRVQPDVAKVVLQPPRDLEPPLELDEPLLQVVVVDQVAVAVLQRRLARGGRRAAPVLLLLLAVVGAPRVRVRRRRRHVVLLQQRLALVPGAAPRHLEELLAQQLAEQAVLAAVVVQPAVDVGGLVRDARVRVGRVEAPQVAALVELVLAVFAALLLPQQVAPPGRHAVEHGQHAAEARLARRPARLEHLVDLVLHAQRVLELQQRLARRKDVRRPAHDVLGEVAARDLGQHDRLERLLRPLGRPVEQEVDALEEPEDGVRQPHAWAPAVAMILCRKYEFWLLAPWAAASRGAVSALIAVPGDLCNTGPSALGRPRPSAVRLDCCAALRARAFCRSALFRPWTLASLASALSSSRPSSDTASSTVEMHSSDVSANVKVSPRDHSCAK